MDRMRSVTVLLCRGLLLCFPRHIKSLCPTTADYSSRVRK
ncbi:unnamed protein product [Chondrus crispus]|uniref:Uncharacterized protein n=1 Tax=Chondrus crispus TaxID=2769 RepID=R7QBV2_CHOCR|nr:unnamed protein product [Chondrus crispus]CDF35273.1 unnamed protein product [Chondrus crispus]|eukprot:XP_005715092.1 unnamed protein product [Chondrus crispus]